MIVNLLHWHSGGTGQKPQQAELKHNCSFSSLDIKSLVRSAASLYMYVNQIGNTIS